MTLGVAALAVAAPPLAGSPAEAAPARPPTLEALRTEINFWKAIFSTYTSNQVLFHDRDHLGRVYSALDFTDLENAGLGAAETQRRRAAAVAAEAERLRELLRRLHSQRGDRSGLSKEDLRIARMFAADPDPLAMLRAAEEGRVRGQTGLRDRFLRGLQIARRYLPTMERIFRAEGLPVELTRLPFVESAFNIDAYSKVGAAGIWQFMPSTGRLYMTVNDHVDERRDPITATYAAARHLKGDYDALGSWPLAVTAYNHGRGGVARAVNATGSRDLVKIVREYRGPSFGFASRNFYVEFLAAVEVVEDAERHFGTIQGHDELRVETVHVPVSTSFEALCRAAAVDGGTLAELNPALSERVVSGRAAVPRGYRLHLPAGHGDRFAARSAGLPAVQLASASSSRRAAASRKPARAAATARIVRHKVRHGQTLSSIARQYQTTVSAIRRHNRLRDKDHVVVGQTLLIPRG